MATSQRGEYQSSATQLHVTLESVSPSLVSHFLSELTREQYFWPWNCGIFACGTVAFISSECGSLINKTQELMEREQRSPAYWLTLHGLLSLLIIAPRTASPGLEIFLGWTFPYPSPIKKCPTGFPTGQSFGGIFI